MNKSSPDLQVIHSVQPDRRSSATRNGRQFHGTAFAVFVSLSFHLDPTKSLTPMAQELRSWILGRRRGRLVPPRGSGPFILRLEPARHAVCLAVQTVEMH